MDGPHDIWKLLDDVEERHRQRRRREVRNLMLAVLIGTAAYGVFVAVVTLL